MEPTLTHLTLKRLVLRLAKNEFLAPEDRSVVKDVVYALILDTETVEDVNEKLKGQVRLEADMVYLMGVYRDLKNEFTYELEEEEGHVLLDTPRRNDDGYKTSAKELKAHSVTNPEVAVKRRRLASVTSLYESLQLLWKIVFARNEKLEQLSVNYRKELKADER